MRRLSAPRQPGRTRILVLAALALPSVALQMRADPGDTKEIPSTWAFEPLRIEHRIPLPPNAPREPFVRGSIDEYVLRTLQRNGLTPSSPAAPVTLFRRVTLDVTGLPPSPEQIAEFLAEVESDGLDAAYERTVDRLLASPQYAERCAIDWLDLVRFAETNGFEMNQERPDAWGYRDWVIDAFDRDASYSEFVRAQLAGDTLGQDAATGFLVAGTWDQVKSPDPELTATQRDDELHGMVATTGAAFLGLTVGCAKCHDHKFDPIDQHDYYALRACFEGVEFGSRPWRREMVKEPSVGRDPVDPLRNVETFTPVLASGVRFVVTDTSDAEPCIDELEVLATEAESSDVGRKRRNVALADHGARARASSVYEGNPKHTLEHVNDGRYGNDFSWIAKERTGFIEIEFAQPTAIDTVIWGRDRKGEFRDRVAIGYRIEVLAVDSVGESRWREVSTSTDRKPYALREPSVYAGRFEPRPRATHRLERGNPMEPREEVRPGGLKRIPAEFPKVDLADEPARRRALAEWIVSPANPLPSRVMVNRIWQQHFGRGLVETPSDFGAMGFRPTHPELLDALAADFLADDGKPKALHRRILLSSTYRQSSAPRSDALAVDAENRLLWRFAPRRLPAEAIRDSMLSVAGVLDLTRGGPSVSPFAPNDNYVRVYEPKTAFTAEDFRRSVYLLRVRMHPEPTFKTFDLPEGGQPCPRRANSVTPLQALSLTHAPFVLEMARRLAERVERERPSDLEAQITRLFERTLGRTPTATERTATTQVASEHGLAVAARALLGASEFLWLE